MSKKFIINQLIILAFLLSLTVVPASAATASGRFTFTNTPLLRPEGERAPTIAIARNGTMAVTGLQFLFDPNFFGTHLWTGPFGTIPDFQGLLDDNLQKSGKQVFGSGDADVDIGSTGTLHATTLIYLINPTFNYEKLGASAITCPNATSPNFNLDNCTKMIIDTTTTGRQWITSDGSHVYISYPDSGEATLIHVQRSDDDGYTWKKVGDPIVGQDGATGDATFNNTQGPLVTGPVTHNVYDIYAAGESGIQKGSTTTYNNIYVSRSSDMGKTWTANLVYHAPIFTDFSNIYPSLAVDPSDGNLYATWSDGHTIFFSASNDQGTSWSPAVTINVSPANTALFPWLAAYNGKVDLVYYGTTASSKDDPSAVWNVYMAQTLDQGDSFTQSLVSKKPNHIGAICTSNILGIGCAPGTRELLDLFEVAINPQNGLAGIIYTDDTLTTTDSGDPLPQIVLAQEKP